MKGERQFGYRLIYFTVCYFFILPILPAQSNKYNAHGWQLLDYRNDSVFGAGVSRAYDQLLKGKEARPVIVAVIDVGVDTAQEDLIGHFWINPGEIPGNGIDDDHNGYVDDVYGWNFLGGKDGRNITVESFESYREYYRLKNDPYGGDQGDSVTKKLYWEKVRKYFLKDSLQLVQMVNTLAQLIPQMRSTDSLLKISLHKDSIFAIDIAAYQPIDSASVLLKKNALMYFRRYGITPDMTLGRFVIDAEGFLQSSKVKLNGFTSDPNAQRREMVRDDFNNIADKNYGNNNVSAGNPEHGTHVAGIIAASRNNGKGIDGIDDQVKIMVLRAVPDGDERDKDIALAIRYAVDNGARIVNMSFGKYFSPGKTWVDDAVRYAGDHDVLLVDAAGNENRNLDSILHFPNPVFALDGRRSDVFITVAASSGGPDSLILARFSNYGKKEVDLFAPGIKLYSTLPNNQYATYSGTSMAAPMVTGVAALILEYYPLLSARQVKYILTHSVMLLPDNDVKWSAGGKGVDFSQLSATGGILNAYNALQMAAVMKGERKKP